MTSRMKPIFALTVFSALLAVAGSASAQQIFRCAGAAGGPPEYINNPRDAQARNCKPMAGGNVTIVQGTPVPRAAPGATAAPRVASNSASGNAEQRQRDSDSRLILEAELRKAETQLAALQKEYNNGQPEKQGIEGRNYQRYLDRVAEMKDSLARAESDVSGLKREIARLPASSGGTASAGSPPTLPN